jgi:hypothetical protein
MRKPSGVYRLDKTVWRVTESVEGGLRVEVLTDGVWVPGRTNMVGLRLHQSTRRLSPQEIKALPA